MGVMTATAENPVIAVLHVGGLHYASEKAVVEDVLGRRPGVLTVEANPVAQTATVAFDPDQTSLADLRRWVEECGYHCAGQSAPGHVCDPLVAPDHGPHDHAAVERADDAHGHGHGGHAGMSMEAMVRDMRNRFLVALVFTVPIVLWSMVGTELLGTELATPFGIDPNRVSPTGDQMTVGMVKTSATRKRLRMSRSMSSIDMPAWPPWPCASSARSIAAWSAGDGGAPSSISGSQMWSGTERPAQ